MSFSLPVSLKNNGAFFSIEQRVFMVVTYCATGSLNQDQGLFRREFPRSQLPYRSTIIRNVDKYLEYGVCTNRREFVVDKPFRCITDDVVVRDIPFSWIIASSPIIIWDINPWAFLRSHWLYWSCLSASYSRSWCPICILYGCHLYRSILVIRLNEILLVFGQLFLRAVIFGSSCRARYTCWIFCMDLAVRRRHTPNTYQHFWLLLTDKVAYF